MLTDWMSNHNAFCKVIYFSHESSKLISIFPNLEFKETKAGCGNVGESTSVSVSLIAQYLPTPVQLTWNDHLTKKEVT